MHTLYLYMLLFKKIIRILINLSVTCLIVHASACIQQYWNIPPNWRVWWLQRCHLHKQNEYIVFYVASIIIVVGDFQGKKKPVGRGVVGESIFFPRPPPSLLVMYKETCKVLIWIGTCNFSRQCTCIFKIVKWGLIKVASSICFVK